MYKKTILDNQLRVVTEKLDQFHSVSIGVWIKMGSRHESSQENGISHFVEHLLFKGTKKRSYLDIALEIDSVGGVLNAFTSREYTCYYVKVIKDKLELAIDLLSDILLNSLFDPQEMEKERKVILQEISMVEDTPDEWIHDLFNQSFWKESSLGRPIMGTIDTVSSFTRNDILNYFEKKYIPQNMIISATGSFKHEHLVELVDKYFGGLNKKPWKEVKGEETRVYPQIIIHPKKLEQVHICLGLKALPITHPKRYECYILNTYLGSGMSSRLFQKVREEKGLAYSVYSYLNPYLGTGSLVVYVATRKENVQEVLKLIVEEFKTLKEKPIKESDLTVTKEHLKGQLVLNSESTDSRMTKLAKNEMYFQRFFTMEEVIAEIDSVTQEKIKLLAEEIFKEESIHLILLGEVGEDKLDDVKQLLQ